MKKWQEELELSAEGPKMLRGRRNFLIATAIVTTMLAGASVNGQTSEETKSPIVGGLAVTAEPERPLDSKKMKAGDAVAARTLEALKVQGTTILPNGTKLIGHLVQAQARANGDQDSLLAMQFDKAVLKNKEELPIALVIRAIAPAPRGPAYDAGPGADPAADRRIGVTTSPMGGSQPAPPVAGSPNATANGRDDGDATGGLAADGRLTPTSRGVYGIKGMRLALDSAKTPPVSVVISTEKSARLDSGTRLLFFTETVETAGANP